ncbi:hypothetical protein MHK_008538, partial [Candidatus Magnetomorum sp. HK-1]
DGLYREVEDKTVIETIFTIKDPQTICDQLITLANKNGGADNITVIVAHFDKKSWYKRFFAKSPR